MNKIKYFLLNWDLIILKKFGEWCERTADKIHESRLKDEAIGFDLKEFLFISGSLSLTFGVTSILSIFFLDKNVSDYQRTINADLSIGIVLIILGVIALIKQRKIKKIYDE